MPQIQVSTRHDLQLAQEIIERRNLQNTREAATVLDILFPERCKKEKSSILSQGLDKPDIMAIDAVLADGLQSSPPKARKSKCSVDTSWAALQY